VPEAWTDPLLKPRSEAGGARKLGNEPRFAAPQLYCREPAIVAYRGDHVFASMSFETDGTRRPGRAVEPETPERRDVG